MAQPHYVTETQILRGIANDTKCRYRFTTHADEQMRRRGITAPDIEHCMMNGHVVLAETKQDILWRVRGKDLDERELEALVVVDETAITIKVITAF
jgi:Domain of unknown function (DUF4258)